MSLLRPSKALFLLAGAACFACTGDEKFTTTTLNGEFEYQIQPASMVMNPGEQSTAVCYRFKPGVSGPAQRTCAYISLSPAIATAAVPSGGTDATVTAASVGITSVRVEFPNNEAVANLPVEVRGFTLAVAPASVTKAVGEQQEYTFTMKTNGVRTGDPGAIDVTKMQWSVTPATVATFVSSVTSEVPGQARATFRAAGPGTATITANYSGPGGGVATAQMQVATPPPATVTVTGTQTMTAGNSVQLFVTFRDGAGNVITSPTLSFSDFDQTALAILSQGPNTAVIRGLRAGTFTIRIHATKDGVTASTVVTLTVT